MGISGRVPQPISEGFIREHITIMTRTASFTQYLDLQEAVRYLNSLGFTAATVETVKYHAYYTGKLSRPKIVGRKAYWGRESLDALVEAL
ncbi:DNA-binding protein [Mycobacterium scrofulaceum]|nr:DNA-binding protein [Mycobacterium scrofulaceum]